MKSGKNLINPLTEVIIYDKLINSSAAVAQEVAHLIGSEEVTGSTPVSSLKKPRKYVVFLLLFSCFPIFSHKIVPYHLISDIQDSSHMLLHNQSLFYDSKKPFEIVLLAFFVLVAEYAHNVSKLLSEYVQK